MRAKIVPPTPESISQIAEALRRDEVVGMPTETVYGLAGNARSSLALARIFETKERPTFDPLIIHIGPLPRGGEIEALKALELVDFENLPPARIQQLEILIRKFWPGPLTLVLPKHPSVPDLATSGLPSVAIRMPQHPVALALIVAAQTPLAAPSANRFGRISPTTAEAVQQELGDRISWILDGGPATIGVESTILSLAPPHDLSILRPGGTPPEKIEAALGIKLKQGYGSATNSSAPAELEFKPLAPGMLESHYAPRTPLFLLPRGIHELTPQDLDSIRAILTTLPHAHPTLGLLLMKGEPQKGGAEFCRQTHCATQCRTLSTQGDMNEAARNLFAEMRSLDSLGLHVIFAEPCLQQEGLGFAISDRLRRASVRR